VAFNFNVSEKQKIYKEIEKLLNKFKDQSSRSLSRFAKFLPATRF